MTDELPGMRAAQTAAREMIRAARNMLDALEEIVEDPDAVAGLVGSLGRVARDVVSTVEGAASGAARSADDGSDIDDDIEHIPVD